MNVDVNSLVVKYSAPTKLISYPYGQIWKQIHDDNRFCLWVQTSKQESDPSWMKMGEFLEIAFKNDVYENKFIDRCLASFEAHKNTP